ncbi:molybdenum cofactor biosynthesis protein B [uncultured Adlercreutzia sp.]|uniref:MogA/MoaB family molybdenum cofactor biosynthesis protein n=1 Tax=uncultured Adlercreutzia sp. TaxID=875803 RepID=UPI0025F72E10|nr:MogA/MoaB family molybdenum cofactor biosynthesis protein [uncultured Adlercreutzia sp.]MCI9261874.1 MogA/MoaB family molybdenum cofactor biosynthesis protein [Eggerthellaceae bacterium]MEE0704833.1 MogA/MoaB family molybdenum cofactor biosynthesis protein [Adlercreutzia sp.]
MADTLKFYIITCSDTRSKDTDEAGQKLEALIADQGWECLERIVETDERPFIAGALINACDNTDADIVITCGGSGLSLRDVTPDATADVADRLVPGIAEAMRAHSMAITPRAMLSRAVCAQRGRTLIINLPGSTKAATENWEGIVEVLPHAVSMMGGGGH